MKNHVTLAATWTDEDLDKIKEIRRQYSHEEEKLIKYTNDLVVGFQTVITYVCKYTLT